MLEELLVFVMPYAPGKYRKDPVLLFFRILLYVSPSRS